MSQVKAQIRLMRSLAVMSDAMYLATERTGQAAEAAGDVDEQLHDILSQIHHKLQQSSNTLDELLAGLQNPPTGP